MFQINILVHNTADTLVKHAQLFQGTYILSEHRQNDFIKLLLLINAKWKNHELAVTLSVVFADVVADTMQGSDTVVVDNVVVQLAVMALAGTDTIGMEPSGTSAACTNSDRIPFISSTWSTK